MHLIKKCTSVLIQKQGKLLFKWMLLFWKNNPSFKKFSLGGEHRRRGKFWDVISNPLPKTIDCITNPMPQNEFFNKIKIAIPNIACKTGDPKTIFPNTYESSTGVEIPIVSKKQD